MAKAIYLVLQSLLFVKDHCMGRLPALPTRVDVSGVYKHSSLLRHDLFKLLVT
jgi:hypothetical protein